MYRLIKKIVYLFTFYCKHDRPNIEPGKTPVFHDFLFLIFQFRPSPSRMLWYSSMYSFSSFTSFGSKEMKPVFLK